MQPVLPTGSGPAGVGPQSCLSSSGVFLWPNVPVTTLCCFHKASSSEIRILFLMQCPVGARALDAAKPVWVRETWPHLYTTTEGGWAPRTPEVGPPRGAQHMHGRVHTSPAQDPGATRLAAESGPLEGRALCPLCTPVPSSRGNALKGGGGVRDMPVPLLCHSPSPRGLWGVSPWDGEAQAGGGLRGPVANARLVGAEGGSSPIKKGTCARPPGRLAVNRSLPPSGAPPELFPTSRFLSQGHQVPGAGMAAPQRTRLVDRLYRLRSSGRGTVSPSCAQS